MNKLSLEILAQALSERHGLSQQESEIFVSAIFSIINKGLEEDKLVKIKGIGTFKIVDVNERESIDVNTKQRMVIERHGRISFVPDAIMKDLVNKPFAKFETVVLNEGLNLDEFKKTDVDEEPLINAEETEDVVDMDSQENDKKLDSPIACLTGAEEKLSDKSEIPLDKFCKKKGKKQTDSQTDVDQALIADECGDDEIKNTINNSSSSLVDTQNKKTMGVDEHNANGIETISVERKTPIKKIWALVAIVIVCAAFMVGYLLGQKYASTPVFKTVKIYKVYIQGKNRKKAQRNIDTLATQKDTLSPIQQNAQEVALSESQQNDKKLLVKAKMQVSSGAYKIIGTEKVITVRKGQTLEDIAKNYLGNGMECYVIVYNHITAVKEGMQINIPKLKLAKSK